MQRYGDHSLSDGGFKGRFIERACGGFVLEGHGDLHTEHICLTDPIRIYDCIEFNRGFRINDLLSELAFLIMDLDHRGRHDLADDLYARCRDAKAELDDPHLLTFYKIYRAWVRGKVAALTCKDPHISLHENNRQKRSSQQYFAQSLGYLCKPALVLMCGRMGSGKSYLAQALEHASTWPTIRSDVIRKELAGVAPEIHNHEAYNSGLYAPDKTRQTYQAIFKLCEEHLKANMGVIVDASFMRLNDRKEFNDLAARSGLPCLTVWVSCPDSVCLSRLDDRVAEGQDISDGRRTLFSQQSKRFEVPEDNEITEKIDSRKDVDYNVQLVLSRLISDHGWLR
jgi:predicted kinase